VQSYDRQQPQLEAQQHGCMSLQKAGGQHWCQLPSLSYVSTPSKVKVKKG